MHIPGGETSRLYYMNQNSIGWQTYLFAQMNRHFKVYPFKRRLKLHIHLIEKVCPVPN